MGEKRAYDDEYYDYLDDLRASGVTNMMGAGAYLQKDFDLGKEEARAILQDWMDTYGQ